MISFSSPGVSLLAQLARLLTLGYNLQAMGIISPKANYEENGKELEEWLEPNEYESDFQALVF